MSQVDSSGHMKVGIGGDIVRRRAYVTVLVSDLVGNPIASHARPELHPGEILCERIGMPPCIVRTAAA